MKFLLSPLKSLFAVKPVVASRNVGCFLRLDVYERDTEVDKCILLFLNILKNYPDEVGQAAVRQQPFLSF